MGTAAAPAGAAPPAVNEHVRDEVQEWVVEDYCEVEDFDVAVRRVETRHVKVATRGKGQLEYYQANIRAVTTDTTRRRAGR